MENKKKENSIRNLVNLYTVVMGVSLSLGITSIINIDTGLTSITTSSLFLFLAFLVTIIPFYHGALRHLDDAYIENTDFSGKNSVLIIDFMLLLLHALAFVVLALLLNVANHFAWFLLVILGIDILWGLLTNFAAASNHDHTAEWKWALINTIYCLFIGWYLIDNKIYLDPLSDQISLAALIFAACLIRSMIDYIWGRKFYFPD